MATKTQKKSPRGKGSRSTVADQAKPTRKPAKAVPLEIPQPDKSRVWVRVRQLAPESPLVVHNFGAKSRRQINDKKMQKAKAPRGKYSATEAFEEAKYYDEDGADCIPAPVRRGMVGLVTAAASSCRRYPALGFPASGRLRPAHHLE
jgi:hypothetical protein